MSSAASPQSVLIVGAGLAGLSAAEALRRAGYGGRITLLGAEALPPYDRPPLSKEWLGGTLSEEKVFLRPPAFYDEHEIELRLGRAAVALDASNHEVVLADGERVRFDTALLATGSVPQRLPLPGADLPGVFYLRTLGDARALAEALAEAQRVGAPVALIGAGFIGAEVAAVCRARGLEVTLLDLLPAPLSRALGTQVGGLFAELHRAHGVDVRMGAGVRELCGAGRVQEVITSDGARIRCGLAVIAVGVRPTIDWLAGSGLALGQGVLVDERCATSAPGIYAAGDLAEWPYTPAGGETMRVRLEHWDNALRQGEAAALAMLGGTTLYQPLPYFWSDQYDWRVQVAGYAVTWDRVVLRGQPAEGSFVAGYLADGRLRMAVAVNRVREFLALKKLVAAGAALPPTVLADDATDLRALANRPQTAS